MEKRTSVKMAGGFSKAYNPHLKKNKAMKKNQEEEKKINQEVEILEQKENPDYDLFFRTYAGKNACYITEQDIDRAMADTHLIGKARVNFILGQFDKFYEVYDIDENSPYYVPKENRLLVF